MSDIRNVKIWTILNDETMMKSLILSTVDGSEYDELMKTMLDGEEIEYTYEAIEVYSSINPWVRNLLSNYVKEPYGLLGSDINLQRSGVNTFQVVVSVDLYHFRRIEVNPTLGLTEPVYLTKHLIVDADVEASFHRDDANIKLKLSINDIDTSNGVINERHLLDQGIEPMLLFELTKLHMGETFIPYASDGDITDDDDDDDEDNDDENEDNADDSDDELIQIGNA